MLLRHFAVFLATLTQISALHAAEFTFIDGQADPQGEWEHWARDHCNIRMTGEVAAGDTEKFEALLAKHANQVASDPNLLGNPRIVTLCLNSPGGSLAEAIKLAESIRKTRPFPRGTGIPFITTRLEAGARCESACAIVFMSGTLDGWEDPPYPARSMHPTARLGFHAPALSISGGTYTEQHVNTAFGISIQSIASILRVLHVGEAPDGTPYGGEERWIEASLLETMLRTPANSMRYIETVDDAGRWSIPVWPIPRVNLDYASGWRACRNRLAWKTSRPSKIRKPTPDAFVTVELPAGSDVSRRLFYIIDEMSGDSCMLSLFKEGFLLIDTDVGMNDFSGSEGGGSRALTEVDKARTDVVEDGFAWLHMLMPNTKLASLAPGGSQQTSATAPPATFSPDRLEPRFGGERVILMDHNGSQMAWEVKGDRVWIWYFNPRAGLTDSGVTNGTLLFEGESRNDTWRGTARRFSKKCGDNLYAVKGRTEGARVVLQGQYQPRNASCQPSSQRKTDTLTFDIVMAGVSAPAITETTTAPATTAPATTPTATASTSGALPGLVKVTGVSTGLNMRQGPNGQTAKVSELPAGTTNISLHGCQPAIAPSAWAAASATRKRVLLAGSWCSLTYNGKTGYVSGRYLAPQ